MELNLAFFASHGGSNVKAILDNIENSLLDANPRIIISNNLGAGVLKLAKERNIPYYCLNRKNFEPYGSLDDAILEILKKYDVNLVLLAGYMRQVSNRIIKIYKNRILNIHPSLLPKFGGEGMYGMNVHQAVIQSREIESGATVHLVNEEYDQGKILKQYKVPRFSKDSVLSLANRVLLVEHVLYSQVLQEIKFGLIDLDEVIF